jgi:hypothetical protein
MPQQSQLHSLGCDLAGDEAPPGCFVRTLLRKMSQDLLKPGPDKGSGFTPPSPLPFLFHGPTPTAQLSVVIASGSFPIGAVVGSPFCPFCVCFPL